ncbi:MAG: cupin domain-containing protein [Candidatus Eremiobacteraeota bacterium]|nr:cupin domain-containing protein [Candidatus Eremiobacteraeota bacterium]
MSIARISFAVSGVASIIVGAMCIGFSRVEAADDLSSARVIHMTDILSTTLPKNPKTGNGAQTVYNGPAGSITALQVGDLARHTHDTASEMFYVTEGSAQITLGDTKQSIKAGDLMIVPKGMLHSIKSDSGLLKAVLITMPPRDPNDVHFEMAH